MQLLALESVALSALDPDSRLESSPVGADEQSPEPMTSERIPDPCSCNPAEIPTPIDDCSAVDVPYVDTVPSSFSADHHQQSSPIYSCLTNEQLAELQEAFLWFAVEPPPGTSGDANQCHQCQALQFRLNPAVLGQCLRTIGQNPTKAEIACMVAICNARKKPIVNAPAVVAGASATAEDVQSADKQKPSPKNKKAERGQSPSKPPAKVFFYVHVFVT